MCLDASVHWLSLNNFNSQFFQRIYSSLWGLGFVHFARILCSRTRIRIWSFCTSIRLGKTLETIRLKSRIGLSRCPFFIGVFLELFIGIRESSFHWLEFGSGLFVPECIRCLIFRLVFSKSFMCWANSRILNLS